MKKKLKLSLYLVICLLFGLFFINKNVQAIGIQHIGNVPGYSPEMRRYVAYINGQTYMAYCLDPGYKYNQGSRVANFNILRTIDPSKSVGTSWYEFDLAITYAYQKMQDNGWDSTSDVGRVIGTTAFRYIVLNTDANRGLASNAPAGGQLAAAYNAYLTGRLSGDANLLQQAINLYVESLQFAQNAIANNLTYQDLVEQGQLRGVKWTFQNQTVEQVAGTNTYQITIEMRPETTDVYNIDVNQFQIGFTNATVGAPTITSRNINNNVVTLVATFDGTNWDRQDLGLYVDAVYCDPSSASSNIFLLSKGSLIQRMIVVLPGSATTCQSNIGNPHGGSRVYPNDSSGAPSTCLCDETTGIYTYTDKDGNKTTWSGNESRPSNVPSDANCPGTCTVQKHVCEIIGDQHYCNDGEPCSEQEYRVDCLGEVNCTPTVSLTSDCQDLESGENDRLDGQYDAIVSDINQINTTCNPDTNQIKACVLGREDLTNQSFESTEYELGEDNPYCSVWCNETYQFNLPTARYSTSGGYFTLSMSIKGQRDCYISSADDPSQPINTQKFNEDLETARRAVIDAWNEYSYYKAAAAVKADLDDDGCDIDHCSASESIYTKNWSGILYDYNGHSHSFDGNRNLSWTSPNGISYSGTYSSGTAADCDEDDDPDSGCNCDCDDGDPGDDPDASGGTYHEEMKNQAYNTLKQRLEELNTVIRQYNNCTGVVTNSEYMNFITGLTSSSANSTGWNNKMNFDPTVEFKYYESYLHDIQGEFVMNDSSAELDVLDEEYFTGEVGDTYGDDQDSNQGTNSMNSVLGTRNIFVCNESGCQNIPVVLSNATWIRKTKTNSADFEPNINFSTYTPYGTIKVQDGPNNDYLWTNLPDDAFPVALIRETGVFPFKFTFYDIGQSNSNGSLGRLIDGDSSNTVLVQLSNVEEGLKCNDGDVENPSVDGGYVCHYLNNCPGCDFTCDDDNNCEFDDCDGGYCILDCPNCIFDGENANFSYRTVSLNNMFPNDREIGYNWSQTGKAEATLQEIEEAGESIYEEPQYSYTLSPTNLKNIREYNDDAGSYTNSHTPESVNGDDVAVYCDTVVVKGKEYSVRCKSRFLDLIDSSGNEYATNVIRPDPDDNNSWTLFSDTQYCPNGNCLSDGLGPAWK